MVFSLEVRQKVIDVEYICGFFTFGGVVRKVDDVTAYLAAQPSRLRSAIVTLEKQEGGYALLWEHYDKNNMAARRLSLLQMYSSSSTVQSYTELVSLILFL
jgi:hypothetical protein